MNMMPVGKLLSSLLNYTPRDPKDYVVSEEITQPVFQNGETALVCAHMQMFPRPVEVPMCEERIVHIGHDRSNTHAFLWPLAHFKYVLVCTECLVEAKGNVVDVPITVGGTIRLTK